MRILSMEVEDRGTSMDRERHLSGLREAVKNFGVLDQDTPARCLARGPFGEKVEQPRIVWLGGLTRMGPIAPPQHPLGRGLDVGLADLVDIRVKATPLISVDATPTAVAAKVSFRFMALPPCRARVNFRPIGGRGLVPDTTDPDES